METLQSRLRYPSVCMHFVKNMLSYDIMVSSKENAILIGPDPNRSSETNETFHNVKSFHKVTQLYLECPLLISSNGVITNNIGHWYDYI